MTARSPQLASALRSVVALAVLVALAPGCSCDIDPDDIDVSPCSDPPAAVSMVVNAELSQIRPLGSTILLKVRGNRLTSDPCIKVGSESSFLHNFEGTSAMTQTISNLAHGQWQVEIQALSGGDHEPVTLTHSLPPGSTATLTIGGDASGTLIASF